MRDVWAPGPFLRYPFQEGAKSLKGSVRDGATHGHCLVHIPTAPKLKADKNNQDGPVTAGKPTEYHTLPSAPRGRMMFTAWSKEAYWTVHSLGAMASFTDVPFG